MPKSRGRKPKKKRAPASAPKKRLDNFDAGSGQGHRDEKANGDRAFGCFLCCREIFCGGLASHGTTAALPSGSSHSSRMDWPLFWSECRLWLGHRIVNYSVYGGAVFGRRNDPIRGRRDGAR